MFGESDTGLLDNLNPFHSNDAEDGFNFGKYFSLSYEQRLYGFGIFCALGIILSLTGTIMIFTMNITGFAVTYTLGSVSMILATLFLFGPVKQIKEMFSSLHKGISVLVYFLLIILTLVAALAWNNGPLCIVFLILQFVAYLWYTITSIPGGQTMCKYCCKSVLDF